MQTLASNLAQRVTELERQNRMFKCVGMLSVTLLAALFTMGQTQSLRVIDANEFVLKDKAGIPRARLYMEDGSHPALYFYGPKNNPLPIALKAGDEPSIILQRGTDQILASANREFFGMVLYDEKSHRAAFSVKDGTPAMDFFDRDGNPRASMEAGPTEAAVRLWDTKRSSTVELSNSNVLSDLEILDPGGEVTLGLLEHNAGPRLELRDKAGFSAVLGNTNLVVPRTGKTENTSAASLVLFDKDGKVLSSAP